MLRRNLVCYDSSNIHSITIEDGKLWVRYREGTTYQVICDDPFELFAALASANSVGKTLHERRLKQVKVE